MLWVLGMLLVLIMRLLPVLVIGHVVLRLVPPRAAAPVAHVCHVSIHIHAAVDASGCSLYVLPSRQMAVTHPAGLGDRTVADIAQCCSRIYLRRRLSAGRGQMSQLRLAVPGRRGGDGDCWLELRDADGDAQWGGVTGDSGDSPARTKGRRIKNREAV